MCKGSWVRWLLCAWSCLACAHGVTPLGGDWTEARTKHFVIESDLGTYDIQDFAEEFERSYVAIRSCVAPSGTEPPGVSRAIVLGHWEEFESIRPEGSAAFFSNFRSPFETRPTIVLPARQRDKMLEVFQHELVHRFIRHRFPLAPRWLHEGLAQVLSTATLEDSGVTVGRELTRMHWDGAQWMVYGMSLSDLAPELSELTDMNSAIFMQEAVHAYPGSWAFVHALLLGEADYQKAFAAYLDELGHADVDEAAAFARHFDAPLLARIDKSYRQRMVMENFPTQVYPLVGSPDTSITLRPMSTAEAFVLWGRLRMDTDDGRVQAIADAEHAIAAEPRSPEGYLLRATLRMRVGGTDDAVKDLHYALQFSPKDPRLLRALGTVLIKQGHADVEVARIAEGFRATATSADDLLFLARYELSRKQAAAAFDFAIRATHANEGCAPCYEAAAFAASHLGDFERAVRMEEAALRVTGDFDDDLPRMQSRLEEFQGKLARKPAMP